MSKFTEQDWKNFLSSHKKSNFPDAPTSDDKYFRNKKELLYEDLAQMENEGPITFKFYPPKDKGALLNYGEDRELLPYYDMRFKAYQFYGKQVGKTVDISRTWVGETLHVTTSVR